MTPPLRASIPGQNGAMYPPDGPSRRLDERIGTALVVTFRVQGRAEFIERYAPNVSKGGIFVVTREMHPVGSALAFNIRSADGSSIFSGEGVVRWIQAHDLQRKRPPGVGIQFTNLNDDNRTFLEKILASQMAGTEVRGAFEDSVPPPAALEALPSPPSTSQGAWPETVPTFGEALEIVAGRRTAPPELQADSELFLRSRISTDAWPQDAAERFREVVACQWRLAMAVASRPAQSRSSESQALDSFFIEADQALETLKALSLSEMPEVQGACAEARGSVARLSQELLPTSDAAAIAADLAASEATKRVRPQQLAAANIPRLVVEPQPKGRPNRFKRSLPALAAVLVAVSVATTSYVILSYVVPPYVPSVPSFPLPAGATMVGNPGSGQVILQRPDSQPFTPETIEELRRSVAGLGVSVTPLGPTQVMLTAAKK